MTVTLRDSPAPPGLPAWISLSVLAVAGGVVYIGSGLLLPLVAGLLGSYLINPLVMRLQQRGVARANAVALLLVTVASVAALTLSLGLSTLEAEGKRLIQVAPSFANGVEVALNGAAEEARTTWPGLAGVIPATGEPGWLLRGVKARFVAATATHGGETLALFVLAPVFGFFLLRDGPALVDWIVGRIHPRHIETSVAAWAQIDVIIGQYLRGLALESAAVGLLSGVGLWMIGVPFPALLGLFAALVNPVPYVGVAFSLSVALLVALTAQMSVAALGAVIALFVAIRLVDDVVLVPLTIGQSMHLHPMLVVVSIVIGEQTFGVLGMVFAVPVVTVLKEVALLLLEHRRTLSRASGPVIVPEKVQHIPI